MSFWNWDWSEFCWCQNRMVRGWIWTLMSWIWKPGGTLPSCPYELMSCTVWLFARTVELGCCLSRFHHISGAIKALERRGFRSWHFWIWKAIPWPLHMQRARFRAGGGQGCPVYSIPWISLKRLGPAGIPLGKFLFSITSTSNNFSIHVARMSLQSKSHSTHLLKALCFFLVLNMWTASQQCLAGYNSVQAGRSPSWLRQRTARVQ